MSSVVQATPIELGAVQSPVEDGAVQLSCVDEGLVLVLCEKTSRDQDGVLGASLTSHLVQHVLDFL